MALDNLPIGVSDYELRFINYSTGDSTHSTGTVTVNAGLGLQNTTPPLAYGYNGVTNFGIEGYVWSSPGSYRIPLHRYYLANGNNHHIVTSDFGVIDYANSVLAGQLADPNATIYLVDEGILGYLDTQPSAGNQKLYSLKYGDENIYSISTSLSGFVISTDPNQAFQHGVWYATLFQDLGYIPTVPQAGTQALYHVFNSSATGNLSLGDNFFSTSADEISGLLGTPNISSGAVPGVALGKATIDGTQLSVLQWPAPEAGSRVTVTATPPLLYYGSNPTVFSQGDSHGTQLTQGAGQCVVLQFLQPGASHALSIVIEHPAGNGYGAYQTRTDITVSAPATGVGDPVRVDTTASFPYVPQIRVFLGAGNTRVTDRPEVSRTVDRWGNVTQIDNPRGLGYNPQLHTSYAYNDNNQLIRQTQQLDEAADGAYVANGAGRFEATTKLYYDALGRQVGIQDANGHVNVKTFDAAGNLVQERHADGGVTDTTYDAFGDKLTSHVKMDGSRTVGTDYTYDRLSRLTKTSLELGISTHTVTLAPDAIAVPGPGNMDTANGATLTDSVQNTLQTNTYDEAGRKTSVTIGADEVTHNPGEVTRYAYDLAGNVILSGQVDSSGPFTNLGLRYTTRTSFDALNHKTAQTDGNNNTQTWTYTQQGRLVNHTDFALNLSGTGASQTSPSNSHAVNFSYGYDNAGKLTHVQNDAALAQNIKYIYDIAGNLLGYTDTTQIQPYFSNSGHPSHSTDITTTRTTYAHLGAYAQAGVYTTRSHYGDVNLAQITASGQGPDVTDSAVSTTWYDANGFVSNTTQVQNGNVNNPSTPFNRAFVNDAQGHAVYVNQGAGSGGNSSKNSITDAGGSPLDLVEMNQIARESVKENLSTFIVIGEDSTGLLTYDPLEKAFQYRDRIGIDRVMNFSCFEELPTAEVAKTL